MSQPIVLVTFYSRGGATETLALSHAVGAVQARALIRLRRLRDTGAGEATDEVRRMHKEYVPPTENDVLGADALVVAPPVHALPSDDEWQEFMKLLARLGQEGRLAGKVAAVVNTDGEGGGAGAVGHFAGALFGCGLVLIPPLPGTGPTPEGATAHGRRVATIAGSLKMTATAPINPVRT